jgi:hypothetical protein
MKTKYQYIKTYCREVVKRETTAEFLIQIFVKHYTEYIFPNLNENQICY